MRGLQDFFVVHRPVHSLARLSGNRHGITMSVDCVDDGFMPSYYWYVRDNCAGSLEPNDCFFSTYAEVVKHIESL